MSAIGAASWSRLLRWLEHPDETASYPRLANRPSVQDMSPLLSKFFRDGRLQHDDADKAFSQVASRLRTSRILFVPALLSGVAIGASRLRIVEYLTHQVRRLNDEGFDARIAEIDTGASIHANGHLIAQSLMQDHRPTWLVTHSKGGLDALDALVSRPDVWRYVEGWVAFQSPFYGSPVADAACGSTRARKIAAAALRLFRAELQAICDLRTESRARYMDSHASTIARLTDSIPVTCVGTVKNSMLWPTSRWMRGLGLENDGLVPLSSTALPGSRFVQLNGFAHGEVASHSLLSGQPCEHFDLLKVLFAMILDLSTLSRRTAA